MSYTREQKFTQAFTTCTGTLPVTAEIAQRLRDEGFRGFSSNTHLVAMPHVMPDVVDWISALIELGMPPQNIHILGKQYSQVNDTRDRLKQMGIDFVDYTPAKLGEYYETLKGTDLPKFWGHSLKQVQRTLHEQGPQNILVMDDGGRLLQSIPSELTIDPNIKIIGIEQTTNGVNVVRAEGHAIDIVIPAMSALKTEFEPPFIADASLRKLKDKLGACRNRDVAVIGLGTIGKALSQTLAENQNTLFIYDTAISISDGELVDGKHLLPRNVNVYSAPEAGYPKSEARLLRGSSPPSNINYYVCKGLGQAVQNANYVFGCTGCDIFRDIDLDSFSFRGPNKKIDETRFISASSGDKEFLSLLKWIAQQPDRMHCDDTSKRGSRWDVTVNKKGSKLRVVQQGFPINFDGKTPSGSCEEMQLISSLLLASIVQAHEYLQRYPVLSASNQRHLLMFSPAMQREILQTWIDKVPGVRRFFCSEKIQTILNDPEWFTRNSQGTFCPVFTSDLPTPECLASQPPKLQHALTKRLYV